MGQIAIALDDIVERGGLHEKGKIAFHDAFGAFLVSRDEDGRFFALHVAPHFLVRLDTRILFFFFCLLFPRQVINEVERRES